MHYELAKERLINGKTREAIDMLRGPLENTPLYDEWMMVRARYETLREREMKGLLSTSEAQLEHNRINDAVLRLLDKAERKEEVPVVKKDKPATTEPRQGLPKWASILIVAVVAVGALLFLREQFGDSQEPDVQRTMQTVVPETKADEKPSPTIPKTKVDLKPSRVKTETKTEAEPSRARPDLSVETQTAELKKDILRESFKLIAKYDVSKISGNRDLPFEIHTLSHTNTMILMEMTLTNRAGKPVKLGEMELLHTGDRSVGKSQSLSGTMLEPGDNITDTFKFRWSIPGELKAFRMKMDYAIQGGGGIRALKTDFGLYKKIQ
jgi:hypothetical protein